MKYILAAILTLFITVESHAQGYVAVGGSWGAVAVGTGYYGGYYGYGYGYGAVAPIGGWYPYYYSSPIYAAPLPQFVPVVQTVQVQQVQTPVQPQQSTSQKSCSCCCKCNK